MASCGFRLDINNFGAASRADDAVISSQTRARKMRAGGGGGGQESMLVAGRGQAGSFNSLQKYVTTSEN